jgi:hypothetical protein
LSAQERVNVAAGLVSLPLCAPGDRTEGLGAKNGMECDHCLPGSSAVPVLSSHPAAAMDFVGLLQSASQQSLSFLAPIGLPPATGPPSA